MLGTFLSVLVSTVTAGVVGIRVLGVATRTWQIPETSAGLGLVAFAFAQLCVMVATGMGDRMSPGLGDVLRAFALTGFTLASAGLSLFTVETFGRNAWRLALAASIVLGGAATRVAIVQQDVAIFGHGAGQSVLPSLAALTFALGFLWLGFEGLQYHHRAQRAHAIGLASAEIVNRFLLMGLCGLVAGLSTIGVALVGGDFAGLRSLFICTSGLVTALMCVLTFAPPAAYRNFVEARARRAASHG